MFGFSITGRGRRTETIRVNLVSPCHSRFFSTVLHSFLGASYTPKGSISKVLHIFKPYFAFFRPFLRFLRWKGRTTHHQRKKPPQRRTDGQNRPPLRRRARPLCARWLARLPVRSALRRSGRGAGVFRVRRPCPRPAPRARRSRLRRSRCLRGSMGRSALMAGEWAANNRALVPPGLRRRRPPRRRFAVRWRGRAVSGARGGGQLLPRPLAASPSSVWSAWPLAALSHASARRAGAWPVRPFGAAAARLRPLAWPMAAAPAVAWGKAGLFISRGLAPLPPPRPSKGAPPFPPSCSPCGVRPRAEIIAGDGGRALVPRACGAVGCARGARPCIPAVSAVCLPASGRARSACRAVCAVRALRRASPPSSGGQVRALKGFPILQREHRGTGTRPLGAQIAA